MSTSAAIRERRDDDLASAGQALIRVHETNGYPVEGVSDPIGWLTPENLLKAWVAELDGRIVGHVSLASGEGEDAAALWRQQAGSNEPLAALERLFVAPEARSQGLGDRLVRAAMEEANRIGRRLLLDVMAKDQAAIRLYERLGWRRIGELSHGVPDGSTVPAFGYVAPLHREKDA
ncbi:GNAT family N-acetyltransferase [Nocardiopsis suaedae]|uniref:GNAT family N-acetyltransferase n=1 Tax=Nocardiopsis suaedae TaxID=3018444 RepID=A0ABT4TIE6_9ACTN|nr:GNAT family N-acetyltransferase [Nocardiopsis suaedae]MDA2804446.1 GNAT family N-acetyltransferase [Nocardiopsis suaedae]